MNSEIKSETITPGRLLETVRDLRTRGFRLVQIAATLENSKPESHPQKADKAPADAAGIASPQPAFSTPPQLDLIYSFDLAGELANLRIQLPAENARIPSITPVFWSAFLYENEMHDLFNIQVEGIAVDFHGTLYRTTVKFPFGSTKVPVAKVLAQPHSAVAAASSPTPS